MRRQVFFYANGKTGSSVPVITIQKQSAEDLVRMFLEIDLVRHVDSDRIRMTSDFVSYVSLVDRCSLGSHRVIRWNQELCADGPFTLSHLKDEALELVKDGWTIFEIKIKLFNEAEFDEEMRRISRHLDRGHQRWEGPSPHALMHVEGLSLNDTLLLRWYLSAEGSGEDNGFAYTFILNKYKYFATYEVRSVKLSYLLRDLYLLSNSVKCLEVFFWRGRDSLVLIRSIWMAENG